MTPENIRAIVRNTQFTNKYLFKCPATGEPQDVYHVDADDETLFLYTRGKTRVWKHSIQTEEVLLEDVPELVDEINE
jgi:hypothetical protein